MARSIRRFVTGHDAHGRSILADSVEVPETGGVGNVNLWMTGAAVDPIKQAAEFPFFPHKGETIFRLFRIPPSESLDRPALEAIAEGFFAAVGDPACRIDTSRHPFMHVTPTIDYILLLSGEAALLLDEGKPVVLKPLDAVVQRATNHTWLNTGTEDAVFLAVMVGV